MVETEESAEGEGEGEVPEESITFLYKLSAGACPKSYGFNAARLAGVPRDVIARARVIARRIELEATRVRAAREICKADSAQQVRKLLDALNI